MKVWTIEVCNTYDPPTNYTIKMILGSAEDAQARLEFYKSRYDYVLVDEYELGEEIP